MIVADTDVLIDFLSNKGAVAEVRELLGRGILRTTAITRFELLSGAKNDKHLAGLMELLEPIQCLDLDSLAADTASQVRRKLEASGKSIGMADSLIAGIVISNGGTLLTRNRRHFDRVHGLKLA